MTSQTSAQQIIESSTTFCVRCHLSWIQCKGLGQSREISTVNSAYVEEAELILIIVEAKVRGSTLIYSAKLMQRVKL